MPLRPEDIVGAWHLVDTWIENPDGSRTPTQGPDPRGIIMYTSDGWMSAITRWGTREMPRAGAGDGDKARMFDTYLNYAGRWTLSGDTVTHHIEHALDPNWIGVARERRIEHGGERMVFSGFGSDGKSNAVIVWQKAPR